MHIEEHARKHQAEVGFNDDDIRHAIAFAMYTATQGDYRLYLIGPNRNVLLLEIVVVDPDDEPRVIHAMKLPRNRYRLLDR